MANRYTWEGVVSLDNSGDDCEAVEFDVKAEFSVAWGSSPSGEFGPPENYDPGSASEVEDVKIISIDGLTEGWGKAFALGFQTDEQIAADFVSALEAHHDEMLVEAGEDEVGRAEAAQEARWERDREDRWEA